MTPSTIEILPFIDLDSVPSICMSQTRQIPFNAIPDPFDNHRHLDDKPSFPPVQIPFNMCNDPADDVDCDCDCDSPETGK
jgi:hypothetical protein